MAGSTRFFECESVGSARLAVLVGAPEILIEYQGVGEHSTHQAANAFRVGLHQIYVRSNGGESSACEVNPRPVLAEMSRAWNDRTKQAMRDNEDTSWRKPTGI